MKRVTLIFILLFGLVGSTGCNKLPPQQEPWANLTINNILPVWHPEYHTVYTAAYFSGEPESDELRDIQCPIPMNCRVRNHTGSQCVFSSLECLARWSECKKLLEPEPLTSREGCRSYSGPADAASKLTKFGVKFENSYRSKEEGIKLLKKAMAEGRGALFGVPGHAMVVCHYDEAAKVVKIIDNSDSSLRVQTWTLEKWNQRWDTWIIVIYAEPDLFPEKASGSDLPNLIPIFDRNNPQGKYPKNYIPRPSK